jgi:hypothetical protein
MKLADILQMAGATKKHLLVASFLVGARAKTVAAKMSIEMFGKVKRSSLLL